MNIRCYYMKNLFAKILVLITISLFFGCVRQEPTGNTTTSAASVSQDSVHEEDTGNMD
jgi:uncharacterized lipoprotein YajG